MKRCYGVFGREGVRRRGGVRRAAGGGRWAVGGAAAGAVGELQPALACSFSHLGDKGGELLHRDRVPVRASVLHRAEHLVDLGRRNDVFVRCREVVEPELDLPGSEHGVIVHVPLLEYAGQVVLDRLLRDEPFVARASDSAGIDAVHVHQDALCLSGLHLSDLCEVALVVQLVVRIILHLVVGI